MDYTKPLPVIDEDNSEYWKYCSQHDFRMEKCKNCGHIRFPPELLCPKCHSTEAEWAKLSGRGTVYSFVIFERAYHKSYKDDIPYAVGIIHLEEGPRIVSNITGIGVNDIKIDMPVELYFDDVTDEVALPKFKPVK